MTRAVLLTFAVAAALASPSAAQKMYFAGNGNGNDPIYQANLDGSGLTTIVSGLGGPQDIYVDSQNGKIYWTDSGKIQRSNLDGTMFEDVITGLTLPRGLTVDAPAGHVYWTSTVTKTIERANLDGTGGVTLASGLNAPIDVVLDKNLGLMFWIDVNNSLIQSANLDGTNVQTIASVNGWAIDLDRTNQRVYWARNSAIGVVNYDGTGFQTLISSGLSWADGIAIDVAGGKMYWCDRIANKIQNANLDGTGVTDLVAGAGLDTILDVELDLGTGCQNLAGSSGYGTGVPGTLGTPSFTLGGPPMIGSPLTLIIQNSLGAPTTGLLVIGLAPAAIPGFWGGDLLVTPAVVVTLPFPAGGLTLAGAIPNDTVLCGLHVYLQAIEADPGAAAGASSTPGLDLLLGS